MVARRFGGYGSCESRCIAVWAREEEDEGYGLISILGATLDVVGKWGDKEGRRGALGAVRVMGVGKGDRRRGDGDSRKEN